MRSVTWRPGLLSFNSPHGFRSLPSHCGHESQLPSSSLKTVAPHAAQIICVTVPNAMISSPSPLLSTYETSFRLSKILLCPLAISSRIVWRRDVSASPAVNLPARSTIKTESARLVVTLKSIETLTLHTVAATYSNASRAPIRRSLEELYLDRCVRPRLRNSKSRGDAAQAKPRVLCLRKRPPAGRSAAP